MTSTPLATPIHDSTFNHAGRDQYNLSQNIHISPQDEHLPHALFSPFNCKGRAPCLEGTRADILDQIFRWIGIGDLQPQFGPVLVREPNTVATNTSIFWINGSAGTGKTTIAYTVAEECRMLGLLGASFFCSRDDADCSNPNIIFTTIAYQLGISNTLFRAEVARAMKRNPGIGYTTPPYQLEELIIKPLRTLRNSLSPCVVVLDALDELKDTDMTSIILSSLSRHVDELPPLKFLVTSRPENHITAVFKSNKLNPVTRRYVLHEVELGVVQSDIEHYLSTKLALTRESYHLEAEWPSAEDIHVLTRMSFGLFIFASTSIRFVEDRNCCDPKCQLARLLCNAPTATEASSPHYNLDRLYDQVLNNAFPQISSALSDRLKMILGTIVLLRDPLSSVALEQLLGVPPRTVGVTLRHLHSVIMVPDDDNQAIRTLHPSFCDFIMTPARCHNPKLVVDPQTQHSLLARACLRVMKRLKRDICGIKNPSMLNNKVDNLPACIMTSIPPELQYACRHWAWHLSNAMFSDVLVELMKEFCSKYLLYWIEALSLLGELQNGLFALSDAQQAIDKTDRDMSDTMVLLRDCGRFTLEFFPVISTCSLQVYHSALLFTPEEAPIKKTYRRELDIPIKVYNGLDNGWNSCTRTIEGHSGSVESVAFSPDGTRIVSGSRDTTLRLWDAVSGAHLNTFTGHSSSVNSSAFSPDGTRIVSGSDDNTVRLWDALSGAHLTTFKGHYRWVRSVAFSPDGTHIASGSNDNTVRLWDAVNGSHLNTFKGHSGLVNSVVFPPDGKRIVSGSRDCTLRLWDVVSGAHLNSFKGHSGSVNSAAFSPDGMRIVSGSNDNTVRLWDAASGAHLTTFKGHSHWVISVSFSPDGMRIVSGSDDKAVRLWDAVGSAHLNTLEGHSSSVKSVAFSSDGMHIVSGSDDCTLRLWDEVGNGHLNTFKGHSHSVNSLSFSPDGMRIVSGSDDNTAQLWDAASGARLNTFKGHWGSVNSVAFSPDGTRIVSGSSDGIVWLWDVVSGADLKSFMGHAGSVNSSAFSPDGTRIVSGSSDCTVRLWDAISGAHLQTFWGHSNWVISVSFSPDGTRIVSGSDDKTVRLWNAQSGVTMAVFNGHSGSVKSVAFSPDGTYIVSASSTKSVRLWDVASGAHLQSLRAHFSNVGSIARSCRLSRDSLPTDGLNPTGPIFGYVAADGWVHSLAWKRRICWVPVSHRPVRLAANEARAVFNTNDGRVIILDFTGMDAYFRNL